MERFQMERVVLNKSLQITKARGVARQLGRTAEQSQRDSSYYTMGSPVIRNTLLSGLARAQIDHFQRILRYGYNILKKIN